MNSPSELIGKSSAMQFLRSQIKRVAKTNANVLIRGETGTGKELVAALLHRQSTRSHRNFCAINCAALTETLFESELFGYEKGAFTGADQQRQGHFERANRGTVFLDEIGELSLTCQAKLLRVVEGESFQRIGGSQSVQVDVRVFAATNRDLWEMVQDRSFRSDLYYRLRVIEIRTPPLRDRGDDVADLARMFLMKFCRESGISTKRFSKRALDAIGASRWPGNVRELRNAIQRATILATGTLIELEDLDLNYSSADSSEQPNLRSLAEIQRQHVRRVLVALQGNKSAACKVLGISRATLYNKLIGSASSETRTSDSCGNTLVNSGQETEKLA